MSTAAQTLANQANAQFSTGPQTPEGKAAASRNAATHGLSNSAFTLLPTEDLDIRWSLFLFDDILQSSLVLRLLQNCYYAPPFTRTLLVGLPDRGPLRA